MLSPSINDVSTLLASSLNEMVQLDGYAMSSDNTRIGVLVPDPDWLPAIRNRFGMLGKAGASWTLRKPEIWSSVLVQFTDYATTIASVVEQMQGGKVKTSAEWQSMLADVLFPVLDQAARTTKKAGVDLDGHYQQFKDVQPLLEDSIERGWSALSSEEAQMVKIAGELGSLQTQVKNLESQITGNVISGGKGYISSTVSIGYSIVTAASTSIPYLSILTLAITIGKTFYDIIEGTDEINKTLEKIGELQLEASQAAQAAAGAKAVLQIAYDAEKSFLAIRDFVPSIATMWETERDKVKAVQDALRAGADPQREFELATLPVANENWGAINTFARAIPNIKQTQGKPVALNPITTVRNHA